MSLATICRAVYVRAGVGPTVPSAWNVTVDPTAREIVEYVNEAHRVVADAHEWGVLLREGTGTLNGARLQSFAAAADFDRMLGNTLRMDGASREFRGPVTDAEFQAVRWNAPGYSDPLFRLAGSTIEVHNPSAWAGTAYYRYVTSTLTTLGTVAARGVFASDDDTALIDERLIVLRALVDWREGKGLPAEVAERAYIAALARAKSHERPVGVLNLGGGARSGRSAVALGGGLTSVPL